MGMIVMHKMTAEVISFCQDVQHVSIESYTLLSVNE